MWIACESGDCRPDPIDGIWGWHTALYMCVDAVGGEMAKLCGVGWSNLGMEDARQRGPGFRTLDLLDHCAPRLNGKTRAGFTVARFEAFTMRRLVDLDGWGSCLMIVNLYIEDPILAVGFRTSIFEIALQR